MAGGPFPGRSGVCQLPVGEAVVTRSRLSQFHELAEFYDPLNAGKDYRSEVRFLEAIARRLGPRGRTSWLDVACGSGRHLEYLRRKHRVVGVDASREMLRLARRRVRGAKLVRGDMRTFRLGQRFDVVSCLFSAIGHLPTKSDVRKTFVNFALHLNPGGVAVVEPWIAPSIFRAGFLQVRSYDSPAVTVARFASSGRRGKHSIVRYDFYIGKPGREIQHRRVTDVGLLLSPPELLQLMRAAGLRPRFLVRGLTRGRGLLVGIKPRAKSSDTT